MDILLHVCNDSCLRKACVHNVVKIHTCAFSVDWIHVIPADFCRLLLLRLEQGLDVTLKTGQRWTYLSVVQVGKSPCNIDSHSKTLARLGAVGSRTVPALHNSQSLRHPVHIFYAIHHHNSLVARYISDAMIVKLSGHPGCRLALVLRYSVTNCINAHVFALVLTVLVQTRHVIGVSGPYRPHN